MAQFYFDPSRESEPHALPDGETFEHKHGYTPDGAVASCCEDPCCYPDKKCGGPGWYWWACFPGCLPDSDPIGPFDTEGKALDDARVA